MSNRLRFQIAAATLREISSIWRCGPAGRKDRTVNRSRIGAGRVFTNLREQKAGRRRRSQSNISVSTAALPTRNCSHGGAQPSDAKRLACSGAGTKGTDEDRHGDVIVAPNQRSRSKKDQPDHWLPGPLFRPRK